MTTSEPTSDACPVCRRRGAEPFAVARDVEYRTSEESFTYLRCAACGVVFLAAPPVDRLTEIYPLTYYSYADAGRGLGQRVKTYLDRRLFRRILRDVPGDRLAVLDVGGGTGWMLTVVRGSDARVAETHEVDLDESARAAAEAAGHVFHCTPIERFAGVQGFDLVLLLNIIEHVVDPGAVLRIVRDRLTPGGRVLVKTPNTDTLDCRMFQHRSWGGFHCPRHWVLFTAPAFVELARTCGLACEWVRYTQGAPQWTPSLLGLLADRSLVTVTPERPMYRHPLYGPMLALTAGLDFLRLPFAKTAQMFVLLRRADS